MPIDEADQLLVSQIKAGDAEAWSELIARYEGRLLAFVNSRLAISRAVKMSFRKRSWVF